MGAKVEKIEGWTSLEYRQGFEKGFEEGFEEGYREVVEEAQQRYACKLLAIGMRIEDICDVTELTPEQVERLRNNAH